MFPALTSWEAASLLFKALWYFSVIMATGGSFAIWLIGDDSRRFLQHHLSFVLLGALLGFHALIAYLLIQVGTINNRGLAGMLDWSLIQFYLGLDAGETLLLRMFVLLLLIVGQLAALAWLARLMRPPGRRFFQILLRFNAFCLVVLLLSFQATGHIAPLPLPARIALPIHVLGVSLWLGSLWPLLLACSDYGPERSRFVLARFGSLARVFVGGLLVAGTWLVFQLIASPAEMLGSTYGLALTVKLVLVCGLLGLAAINRWMLVPGLRDAKGLASLRRTIRLELLLGIAILVVTVYLSTVVGPVTHES